MIIAKARNRVVIEAASPEVDGGAYPAKRIAGEIVGVEADVFAEGHDEVACAVVWRRKGAARWNSAPMRPLGNDRWRGEFRAEAAGFYEFTIKGWVDEFASWRRGLKKKADAGQEVSLDLKIGGELLKRAARRAKGEAKKMLAAWGQKLASSRAGDCAEETLLALSEDVARTAEAHPDRKEESTYPRVLLIEADRARAGFSAWYELFPRSWGAEPGQHGTFKELEARLPYVAGMGFDVLYLPPIHPIGTKFRKGRNNALECASGDPGSPWAIGSAAGGHKAIAPELGTLKDFKRLAAEAKKQGLEIALDIALQCSPDHPYVAEHPEWFRKRPDGTIQYAENPPKKYQDIYPFDFECEAWRELWEELRSIFLFWIEQGVGIFRVDNPHTKPFKFWQWAISTIKKEHPGAIFLAEAFTRPKVMRQLAKLGFSQSYTYFAWRNERWNLRQYFEELASPPVSDFFRPNLWPNTPDILNEYLQHGGRPAFMTRLVLAATLAPNYGIYGPAFELCEAAPREPGSEEYLDSEKYEIRAWDFDRADSLRDFIARVNRIRRENRALQVADGLAFHDTTNEQIICYSRRAPEGEGTILAAVNLDPHRTQSAWVNLRLDKLGLDWREPFQVHDLLSDARYIWRDAWNFVELNPGVCPAHVFRIRLRERTEQDFDYYV